MKKIFLAFYFIITLIIATNISAYAEEYSARNGVSISVNVDKNALYKISFESEDNYYRKVAFSNGGGLEGFGGFVWFEELQQNSSFGITVSLYADSNRTELIDTTYTLTVEEFNDCGICGDDLRYDFNSDGTLNITGMGEMYDYTSADFIDVTDKRVRPPWYGYIEHIKAITIGEGVTHVGDCAFWYDYFGGTTKSLSLPSTLKTIGDGAFSWRCDIKNLNFPEGLISIGDWAFCGIEGLTNLKLPDSLEEIGERAFYGNDIENIDFGTGIKRIGEYAFSNNESLTSVTIPASLQTMDTAFCWCDKLKKINIDDSSEYFKSVDDIIYSKDGKKLVVCPPDLNKSGTVIILDGTEIICERAFDGCEEITEIVVPEGVTTLGSGFASGCKLNSLRIPSTITNLDTSAFFTSLGYVGWELPNLYYNGTQEEWELLTSNHSWQTLYGDSTTFHFIKPQNVTVLPIGEKTYGESSFIVTATPDATSRLDNFTFESSNTDVATVAADGTVTIKAAGETNITVKEAGNEFYAPFTKTQKLVVKKADITIKADDVTIIQGAAVPTFTYTITSGQLFGDDEITGAPTTAANGSKLGTFDITKGTLAVSSNYNLTFAKGTLTVLDKTPQNITVSDITEKTYGDNSFVVTVTPDATSHLNEFTFESSNTDVAEIATDGTVTIKAAGETDITVKQAGNDEYASVEKTVKLVVKPVSISVISVDLNNKTAVFEGILAGDTENVELDFDNIKTTVISSSKTTVDEATTVTTTIKVSNFVLKGEKAGNYVVVETPIETAVSATTVNEKLTDDENITIEAAPVDDKTIIITDVVVAPESEVKKVTIDVTTIADTKVNTVAIPKAIVDTLVSIDAEAVLEITLKNGSDENKTSTITFNAQALAAIQTAGSAATTLSISVNEMGKEELEAAQIVKFEEVSTKTPVVYNLNVVDENGNSVATDFGATGIATVKLPYAKPGGNGNIIVKYLDDLGNLTNISNPKYDATNQIVTVELEHFSEYLIYTEPVRTSSGGGGSTYYTIKFNTNDGTKVSDQRIKRNAVAKAPEAPTKDGFTFEGWYTDKELTKEYDFAAKVTKSMTLYAKWAEIDKLKSQIILTIGDKNAKVFGENKANDVAPKIVNDRTMLPARFVAESLGANVEWDETAWGIVTITKDDIKIVIYIGEEYAVVNGKKVKLDSPAFIENDRTYTPIRFISEELGAKVEWLPETQQVVITK